MRAKLVVTVIAVILMAAPALAHHSFANEYDKNKAFTLKGTVTKLDLLNPHSWLYINVKDANGKIVSWGIEMPPPHDLAKQGVRKDSMPIGMEVTVEGFLAKNGSNLVNGKTVRLADGRTFVMAVGASAADTDPQKQPKLSSSK